MAEAESVEIRVMSVQLQDVPFKSSGQCKFGITCKFHSPLYAGSPMSASAPQFFQPVQSSKVTPVPEQYGGAATGFRVARTIFPGSYVPKANGHMLISPWTCFND
ncbi:hypothetical protein SAY86_024111 [Trapa natans]|nr:hypothetical protein SAY86_024111 [Trapa natans]